MITLNQARKLLPKDSNLTDEQLSSVIADCYLMANLGVDNYLRGRKEIKENESI